MHIDVALLTKETVTAIPGEQWYQYIYQQHEQVQDNLTCNAYCTMDNVKPCSYSVFVEATNMCYLGTYSGVITSILTLPQPTQDVSVIPDKGK